MQHWHCLEQLASLRHLWNPTPKGFIILFQHRAAGALGSLKGGVGRGGAAARLPGKGCRGEPINKYPLDELKQVAVRDVWPTGAQDFTPWLSQQLPLLSERPLEC